MRKEVIRNSNKAAEETGLTVKIQKPNIWQQQKTNKYKNVWYG